MNKVLSECGMFYTVTLDVPAGKASVRVAREEYDNNKLVKAEAHALLLKKIKGE